MTASEPRASSVATEIERTPLFGPDGMRRFEGTEVTPPFIAQLMGAYAHWIDGAGPVLLAHDHRTSSDVLARRCAVSLQRNGVDVYELSVMPAPCLSFNVNVHAMGARAGLMLTAWNDPNERTRIQFVGVEGREIPPEAARAIEAAFTHHPEPLGGGQQKGRILPERGGIERYVRSIADHVDRLAIRQAAPSVILECGHGTGATTGPSLLHTHLGCRLTSLHANPDGSFPDPLFEPSDESLHELAEAVVHLGADVGIAHDGDSDRIALVDERGRYVPGEAALALFARDVLRRSPGATIAASVTASSAIEDVVRQEGGRLVITRSGSLAVATGVAENRATFGGEENGQFYWPEHQNAPDGPMSSAKLIELLVREGRPLSELVREIPSYVVLRRSVPLPDMLKRAVLERVAQRLARGAERTEVRDGVKAFYSDGRLLVRPSGSKPICRIVAESRSAVRADALLSEGVKLVNDFVAALGTSGPPGELWCDPS